MAKDDEDMNKDRKSARSKADFIKLAGIGLEFAEFATEFIEKSENFILMTFEKRRKIENEMDAILSSLGQ